jgi:hypothetical protein
MVDKLPVFGHDKEIFFHSIQLFILTQISTIINGIKSMQTLPYYLLAERMITIEEV